MGTYDININNNYTNMTFIQQFNGSYDYYDHGFLQRPPPSQALLNFIEFNKWACLFIVAFGVAANILCFYIFTRTKLRKFSSSRYFSAIALVDMGYLLSYLCTHLTAWKLDILHVHGFCPLIMYINHICTFLSIWYVTALVIDKFIGLYWPSKKSHYCTVFRAKCVIITFSVLAVVCYHYITWTVGYNTYFRSCVPWPENELMETWSNLNKIDQVVVSVVPYILILCLSCLIAFRTWQYYKRNRSTGFRLHRRQTAFVPQDKEYKTSGLLLVVAFITFGLGIINSLVRVIGPYISLEMQTVGSFLQVNSYSIKPFLYLLGSRPYRKEVWRFGKQLCICSRWYKNSSLSEMQTVSQQTDNGRAIEIIIEKTMWHQLCL